MPESLRSRRLRCPTDGFSSPVVPAHGARHRTSAYHHRETARATKYPLLFWSVRENPTLRRDRRGQRHNNAERLLKNVSEMKRGVFGGCNSCFLSLMRRFLEGFWFQFTPLRGLCCCSSGLFEKRSSAPTEPDPLPCEQAEGNNLFHGGSCLVQ